MDPAARQDAAAVLASVRASLEEWLEEGFEATARAMEEPTAAPEQVTRPVAQPEPTAPPTREPLQAPEAAPAVSTASTAGMAKTLDQVREELGECTRCGLSEGRTQIVFGDGDPNADLMFIGEGPGEQEDKRGLPFVGPAGELLTQMIEKGLQIPRSSVYICNIVKCRPPNNRTPLPPEVSACKPFLDGQIDAVQPRVIVALGKPATSLLMGEDVAITRMRGTWREYRGVPVMPTFHPAYVLRQYTPENRRLVWNDLQAALERSRG